MSVAFESEPTNIWGSSSAAPPTSPPSSSPSRSRSTSRDRPPLSPAVTTPRAIEHYTPASRDSSADYVLESAHSRIYSTADSASATTSTSSTTTSTSTTSTSTATTTTTTTAIEDPAKASQLRKEAKLMQDGLAAILERINAVKGDYERLEGENRFLQDYIGSLMSTSKMLAGRSSD